MVEFLNTEHLPMGMVEVIVRREAWDVAARLIELKLGSADRLLKIRSMAIAASADATSFHPANSAGTFSYHQGTFGLRKEYVRVGKDWTLDRQYGVEAIINEATKVRVVFSNVDVACDDADKPKPRSKKGAGAERVCQGNLFDSLPEFVPEQPDGWVTFYLMVDWRGAVELTRPVVKGGTFVRWIERIYLSNGDDLDLEGERLPLTNDDAASDFDPEVVRK